MRQYIYVRIQWPSHGVGHSAITPHSSDDVDAEGLGRKDADVVGAGETRVAKVVGGGGGATSAFMFATLATISTFSLPEVVKLDPVLDGLDGVDVGGADELVVLGGGGAAAELPPGDAPEEDVGSQRTYRPRKWSGLKRHQSHHCKCRCHCPTAGQRSL